MQPVRRVVIGIHVESVQQDLGATLLALAETTPESVECVLLLDRDEPGLREHAGRFPCLPVLAARLPGRAASFNRLIALPGREIYVFLECGARPAGGWIERLLAALDADPSHGLAGPSTNRSWNEQQIAPHCGSRHADIVDAAMAAHTLYGGTWRNLLPLHSLGDFCYVVTQALVACVGAADEAYGRGPCWEMDYNIRAARAGFVGVWACSAFVYRSPVCDERMRLERSSLSENKRHYQMKFCARQPGDVFNGHCRGDACSNFAVPERMPEMLPPVCDGLTAEFWPVSVTRPRVSCIMPTRGRPAFVALSIDYFRQQDYPDLELIIVYDEDSDLPGEISEDNSIRLVRSGGHGSIGSKRNIGIGLATGEIIAQWDDDDWYDETRISRQVFPILANYADICGFENTPFLCIQDASCWEVTPQLFRRLFVEAVHGGTLVYRRKFWSLHAGYPDRSLREDADFLLVMLRQGARLCRLPARGLYGYVRHEGSSWKFSEGSYLSEKDWHKIPFPEACRHLVMDKAPILSDWHVHRSMPLVSCIMPTAGRERLVAHAVDCFLLQDYPSLELIVIDDGDVSVETLIPRVENVRYVRLTARMSLGGKRNLACEMARGDIIVHWDDDDWMAEGWVTSQVRTLIDMNADVCGLDRVLFYAPDERKAWQYVYDGDKPWVAGCTLCYRKAYWSRTGFPEINVGEDNAFVWHAAGGRVVSNPAFDLFVARIHSGNTSPKHVSDRRWHSYPVSAVAALVGLRLGEQSAAA